MAPPKLPVEICKHCKKTIFNWENSMENLYRTDDTDFAPFKISWTADSVSSSCAFCTFASHAVQNEPDYPGRASDGSKRRKPKIEDLIGKTVEFQNDSDDVFNWEQIDFNRLRTTAAKTMRWNVYAKKGTSQLTPPVSPLRTTPWLTSYSTAGEQAIQRRNS